MSETEHVHAWIELDPTQGLTYDEIQAHTKGMRERCDCGEYRRWPVTR